MNEIKRYSTKRENGVQHGRSLWEDKNGRYCEYADYKRLEDLFYMYRRAWVRELGGTVIPKTHEIDSLVLTTQKRFGVIETLKKALTFYKDAWHRSTNRGTRGKLYPSYELLEDEGMLATNTLREVEKSQ